MTTDTKMLDRSKPTPGYMVRSLGPTHQAFAASALHDRDLGLWRSLDLAIAATWVAYDKEHARAIADFVGRVVARVSLELRRLADQRAERLAPPGVAPTFLAEAIWHRSLLDGSPPPDEEVLAYLDRCARLRLPVSGREEHQPAIQPIERYRISEQWGLA